MRISQQFDGIDIGSPSPVEDALHARMRWAEEQGLPAASMRRLATAVIPHQATQRIAAAYERAPVIDPNAVPAFRQYAREIRNQFEFMTRPRSRGGMGIHAVVSREDPYSGPAEMFQDVRENNRIQVYATGTEESGHHPLLTHEENNMFRAIHDVFGPAGAGRGFDRHGEEAAFVSHAHMFTPMARSAMASETRGQNSWLVAHGGQFPVQKAIVLPRWARTTMPLIGRRGEHRTAVIQARLANENQFTPL